ncbi:hypothetical protein WK80_30555 [Burkholderia multivorans]|nr:hypothetical protein WK80_30555 [Burkholderia multivorans]
MDVVREQRKQLARPCLKKRDKFWETDKRVITWTSPFSRRFSVANSIDAIVDTFGPQILANKLYLQTLQQLLDRPTEVRQLHFNWNSVKAGNLDAKVWSLVQVYRGFLGNRKPAQGPVVELPFEEALKVRFFVVGTYL